MDATAVITGRQQAAITALLSTKTIRAAAKACAIPETTLYRWLREDQVFQEYYREARRHAVQVAVARLQNATSQAAQTLISVNSSKTAKDSERISAAKAILDYSLKAVELEDLAVRVAQLEQTLKEKHNDA